MEETYVRFDPGYTLVKSYTPGAKMDYGIARYAKYGPKGTWGKVGSSLTTLVKHRNTSGAVYQSGLSTVKFNALSNRGIRVRNQRQIPRGGQVMRVVGTESPESFDGGVPDIHGGSADNGQDRQVSAVNPDNIYDRYRGFYTPKDEQPDVKPESEYIVTGPVPQADEPEDPPWIICGNGPQTTNTNVTHVLDDLMELGSPETDYMSLDSSRRPSTQYMSVDSSRRPSVSQIDAPPVRIDEQKDFEHAGGVYRHGKKPRKKPYPSDPKYLLKTESGTVPIVTEPYSPVTTRTVAVIPKGAPPPALIQQTVPSKKRIEPDTYASGGQSSKKRKYNPPEPPSKKRVEPDTYRSGGQAYKKRKISNHAEKRNRSYFAFTGGKYVQKSKREGEFKPNVETKRKRKNADQQAKEEKEEFQGASPTEGPRKMRSKSKKK